MNRRRAISLLGGAVVAWPLVVKGQQQAMPVVGFLNSGSPTRDSPSIQAFRQGLKEMGFVEDQNVIIEYRWAEGQYDRLPVLIADLVQRRVAVIAATGGGSGVAAKTATATLPIVFTTGGDPVKEGLVTSINRPGGNATGVNLLLNAMEGKKLGLLREVIPNTTLIAVLLNPANPSFETQLNDVQGAATSVGQQIRILRASNEREIDSAMATIAQMRAGGILVGADAFFGSRHRHIVALTTRHSMPAIFHLREFAMDGGLMSYGTDVLDSYRQVGIYTGRILKGEKPGDLPVMSSVKFEFVINLKTAKALGLDVPPGLSARADEVIE